MNKTGTYSSEQQPSPYIESTQFHVTSISKLAIMGVSTLGLYIVYCNYRHWLHIRGQRGLKLIPLLCTLFGAFTMYWLMKNIVARSREANQPVEGTAIGVTLMWWVPSLMTLAWNLSIYDYLVNSLPVPAMFLIAIILVYANVTFTSVSLVRIQQAANACAGEPLGLQNSKITWVNVLWIMFAWLPFTTFFSHTAFHVRLM